LYRTWEIFADHQAQGSDCYLGVTRLAEIAGRTIRTMEKNLASLCAKQLLVQRAERKVFRRSDDGTLHSRVVVVKDFGGLYALAHDYHEWTQALSYLAPNRAVISLLEHEPHLVAKLRRFENYRRLLYTRQPGPTVLPREEDRWFMEYQSEPAFNTIAREGETHAIADNRDAIPAKLPTKQLPKDLAEGSLKRSNGSTILKRPERDSVDSAVPSPSPFSQDERRKSAESVLQQNRPAVSARTEEQEDEPVRSSMPTPFLAVQASSGTQERTSFPTQGRLLDQTTEWASHDHQSPDCAEEESLIQTLPGLLLVDSFLTAIAGPFGDQSPKGTRTRVRALLHEAHLSQPAEIVVCLLRAYIVARDTRTIRSEHCHPETGQANRMPLFCTMVQRFVEEGRQRRWWDSSWQRMEEEIASDERMARWWSTHRHLVDPPAGLALNAPEGEPKRANESLLDETVQAPAFTENTPSQQAYRQHLGQDGRASTDGSGRASERLTSVRLAHKADPYQCYIDALMAQSSAPEARLAVS
jgi:hypothetical protein